LFIYDEWIHNCSLVPVPYWKSVHDESWVTPDFDRAMLSNFSICRAIQLGRMGWHTAQNHSRSDLQKYQSVSVTLKKQPVLGYLPADDCVVSQTQ
jgi:hypothetical protein